MDDRVVPVSIGRNELTDAPGALAASSAGLVFDLVRTERPSSAEESAALQGIELGQLLRTIVIRRGADDYVFVLVPGGRQIDWPKLRAHLGVKRLSLPDAEEARTATAEGLAPSGRGEFEITDVLNHYIPGGGLFSPVYDGHWTDAGTVPSLLRAAELAAEDDAAGRLAPPVIRSVG